MLVREVLEKEKDQFNQLADHPLQSWEWGEFRQKTGKKVIRLGLFVGKKLKAGYQLTVHPIPKLPYTLIYFPKGPRPTEMMLKALKKLGQKEKAILVKLEPNLPAPLNSVTKLLLQKNDCRPGQSLFTKYTFQLDLTKSEEELLRAMKPKTRYNIRLAQRHGIKIVEDNSDQAFEKFIELFFETTKRQGFYGHTPDYYRQMKKILVPAGIEHLFLAQYKKRVLAAYIFFTFKNTLYYPYGASTRLHREVMPTYALFWQAIKYGQKMGLKTFDMWGTPGPSPNPKDPWYGFHRFKEGFGPKLVKFIGTYDLIINPRLYSLYNLVNTLRWKFLRLKARF